MDTAYHPDFGTRVAFAFERMPEDSDGQVRFAIAKVVCLIRQDAQSEIIRQDAARACQGGDPIQGVWNLIKPSIKFKQDADIAKDLQLSPERKGELEKQYGKIGQDTVEVFIRPSDQARLIQEAGIGVEDCDGFTMYGACLLTALGIPCKLVTVAAHKSRPNEFSHIYVAAYYNGKRIPLDFSHGEYPGWECPSTRMKEWPIFETPVEQGVIALTPVAIAGALYLGFRWLNRRRAA